MKVNKKQKWVIVVSIIVYVVVIGLHNYDSNDPGSVNYKGTHATKNERK
ncbi:hypothetical protein FEFB_14250 [Fructobacillus sp. EFB-N1]|nr:hypothetical protein [Fructobacillus sp. EFB-N1]KMK52829.1 hypothetical protein FEFB_14250 [Fructobacillus sp. EFB-N1]